MKKIIATLLFLSLIVAIGCQKTEKGPSIKDPFIGGTSGLIISFEKDAPPAEVYDGGDFPFGVVVKLQNEGEYTIPKQDALVTISGVLASEFGKNEAELIKTPTEDIEGAKKDAEGKIIKSTPVFVEFGDFNYKGKLSGNTPFTIRADVCYKYGTRADSMICIRKDNLDTKEGVCTVNGDKKVFNSGAPVQVTDFNEAATAKDKVRFTFTIRHKGNGQIYQQGSKCANSRVNEDKAWVEVNTGLQGLECQGLSGGTATSGYVTIYGNEKIITCAQTVSTNSDYEKVAEIKLTYDYRDNKETTVLVKHAAG